MNPDSRVRTHHDVLPIDTIAAIRRLGINGKLGSNLTYWHHDLVGSSSAILLYDLEQSPALRGVVKDSVSKLLPESAVDNVWAMTYTLAGRLCYLDWHADARYQHAITVYLNEEWKDTWAGWLMWKDSQDELRAIKPEFNMAVVMDPPLLHCTAMNNIQAPLRESIQIFVERPDAIKGAAPIGFDPDNINL